jgi:antitoxin component YwqK of YwqJK toxin-antitoxin module
MRAVPGDQPVARADQQREVVEEFWPDGKPRLRREVSRSPDGTLVNDGIYTRWYQNGLKEYQATYVCGELDGVETAWHQNGQKRTEQHYDHGLRQGVRRDWDEAGRLRREEYYFKDSPDGTWTIWKPDGSIEWQARFDHGKPL